MYGINNHILPCSLLAAKPVHVPSAALAMKRQGYGYRSIVGCCLAALVVFLGFGVTKAAAEAAATSGTSYTEDLTVQRLGQHHVGARFVFRSQWVPQARHRCQDHEDWSEGGEAGGNSGSTEEIEEAGKVCHFEAVFPRAVGVLLDRFKARLRIRLRRTWYQVVPGNTRNSLPVRCVCPPNAGTSGVHAYSLCVCPPNAGTNSAGKKSPVLQ